MAAEEREVAKDEEGYGVGATKVEDSDPWEGFSFDMAKQKNCERVYVSSRLSVLGP